jgi:hypothetical protein
MGFISIFLLHPFFLISSFRSKAPSEINSFFLINLSWLLVGFEISSSTVLRRWLLLFARATQFQAQRGLHFFTITRIHLPQVTGLITSMRRWNAGQTRKRTASPLQFVSYCPYFKKMKVGLCNVHAVCVPVTPPINFRTLETWYVYHGT